MLSEGGELLQLQSNNFVVMPLNKWKQINKNLHNPPPPPNKKPTKPTILPTIYDCFLPETAEKLLKNN